MERSNCIEKMRELLNDTNCFKQIQLRQHKRNPTALLALNNFVFYCRLIFSGFNIEK